MNIICGRTIFRTFEIAIFTDILCARRSFPARLTDTLEATLFQGNTTSIVVARSFAVFRSARVERDVAVGSGVTSSAQAVKVANARQVSAHGSFRASVVSVAVASLLLALQPGVA
jgi:hypothetical protein